MNTTACSRSALLLLIPLLNLAAGSEPTRKQAEDSITSAISFFRENAGYRGAYVYRLSSDLQYREGEGEATHSTGWIEPPGTPFVGDAYLEAYRLTGDSHALEASLEVADALRQSQLESGGWAGSFDLGEERYRSQYRVLKKDNPNAQNDSTLDDNKTQACLRFLIGLDETLEFKNKQIREVIDYGFEKLLGVQYPNGAWPQRFSSPPERSDHGVRKARYPESWPRQHPKKDYRGYYTLNDGTMVDMLELLLEAYRIYGDKRFLEAAIKTGDFFVLAQMPEPQPGWAQQYNQNMEPVWARKFEPPAISGGESQGVLKGLCTIYRATGDRKYLEPIPRALTYYRKSLRKDGRLARFYELRTNRPLYFTFDYQLTYRDDSMPTHYGFVVDSKLEGIEERYQALKRSGPKPLKPGPLSRPSLSMNESISRRAKEAIAAMDHRGAWVETGEMKHYPEVNEVIESKTFAMRLLNLARFIAAAQ